MQHREIKGKETEHDWYMMVVSVAYSGNNKERSGRGGPGAQSTSDLVAIGKTLAPILNGMGTR